MHDGFFTVTHKVTHETSKESTLATDTFVANVSVVCPPTMTLTFESRPKNVLVASYPNKHIKSKF